MSFPEAPVNASMSAWQTGLLPHDPALAERLTESADPYAAAHALGLRIPSYVKFATVQDFLDDPTAGLAPLERQGVVNFYAGARSPHPALPGLRNPAGPFSAEKIVPFLEKNISPADRQAYNLRIAEFLQGICISAQVWRDGTITLDIARGTLPELTSGRITPEFTASNEPTEDNPSGTLQYFGRPERLPDGRFMTPFLPAEDETSVLNTPVRRTIWTAIRSLPLGGQSADVRTPRLPGRYEFAVVDHKGLPVAIFADANPFTKTSVE